jgi:hypothetical protein
VIVGFVAVALLVNVTHLNEAIIRVAVKLTGRLSLAYQFRHPGILRVCGGKKLFHQGRDLERELRVLAVTPHCANLRDILF